MLPTDTDVVIIGGGIMGLFTAYYLEKLGCKNVVVLEALPSLGGKTTSLCAGGIRHQFSSEINIELSKKSMEILRNFDTEFGYPLDINMCGYLFAFTQETNIDTFRNAYRLQNRLGIKTTWLTGDEVRRKLPQIYLDDVICGSFCPDDGLLDPHYISKTLVKILKNKNISLFTDTPVIEIGVNDSRVTYVTTSHGKINTSIIVNASGPWLAHVGKLAGIQLPVIPVAQQLFVTGKVENLPPDLPVVILPDQGLGFHVEGTGLLTGLTKPTIPTDDFSMNVDNEWEATHCELAMKRIPSLANTEILSSWAGLYSETPDQHSILGKIPNIEGFYCAGGYGGHGFMHAPASGLLISEEIVFGKARTINIDPIRYERFAIQDNNLELLKI